MQVDQKKSEGDLKSTEKKGGIESRIKVIAAYAKRVRATLTMLYGGGGNALLAPFAKAHMRRHNPVSLRSMKRFLKEYSNVGHRVMTVHPVMTEHQNTAK